MKLVIRNCTVNKCSLLRLLTPQHMHHLFGAYELPDHPTKGSLKRSLSFWFKLSTLRLLTRSSKPYIICVVSCYETHLHLYQCICFAPIARAILTEAESARAYSFVRDGNVQKTTPRLAFKKVLSLKQKAQKPWGNDPNFS